MNAETLERALLYLDKSPVVALTQRLIRLDSSNPPGHELAVAEAIFDQAREWGLVAELLEVDDKRANVTVRLPGHPSDGRRLLYCGHLDTVPIGHKPWDYPPFEAELVGDFVWGRGAVDMKGGVAAMLAAMAALHRAGAELPGELRFAGVVGEEVNCAGSRRYLADGRMEGVSWLVVAEPTNLDLVVAHKGALRLEISTHGKAAHSSKPELGVNAIMRMVNVLERVAEVDLTTAPHPYLSPPTMSVNTVEGGSAINVVPDVCRAVIDIRTLPSQDHASILAQFESSIGDMQIANPTDPCTEFRILGEAAPVETPSDHRLIARAQRAASIALGSERPVRGVTFFSDASVLQPPTKVPTILFGPGDDALAHQTNERVHVAALTEASRFFATLPFLIWEQ